MTTPRTKKKEKKKKKKTPKRKKKKKKKKRKPKPPTKKTQKKKPPPPHKKKKKKKKKKKNHPVPKSKKNKKTLKKKKEKKKKKKPPTLSLLLKRKGGRRAHSVWWSQGTVRGKRGKKRSLGTVPTLVHEKERKKSDDCLRPHGKEGELKKKGKGTGGSTFCYLLGKGEKKGGELQDHGLRPRGPSPKVGGKNGTTVALSWRLFPRAAGGGKEKGGEGRGESSKRATINSSEMTKGRGSPKRKKKGGEGKKNGRHVSVLIGWLCTTWREGGKGEKKKRREKKKQRSRIKDIYQFRGAAGGMGRKGGEKNRSARVIKKK